MNFTLIVTENNKMDKKKLNLMDNWEKKNEII